MNKYLFRLFEKLCLIAVLGMAVGACKEDKEVKPETRAKIASVAPDVIAQSNTSIILTTQEILDITSLALFKRPDAENECIPDVSTSENTNGDSDTLIYNISVDFGDGSTCHGSTVTTTGKILDTFTYMPGTDDSYSTSEDITFENLHFDTARVDGNFIINYTSGTNTVTIEARGGKLIYESGVAENWDGTITYFYDISGTPPDPEDDIKTLTGSFTGLTPNGNDFSTDILERIEFMFECYANYNIPVSGVMESNVGGTISTIDYGDETCDNTYTNTVNGETTFYVIEPTGEPLPPNDFARMATSHPMNRVSLIEAFVKKIAATQK